MKLQQHIGSKLDSIIFAKNIVFGVLGQNDHKMDPK